jgi:F-type H+-transporting ATPase subunit c
MDPLTIIGLASVVMAGLTIAVATIAPAIGQSRAIAEAMRAIAQQPDESSSITRTLFVGLAMIESFAIYAFVVVMIMIFANPFWNYFQDTAGG